jgi:2-C-methyl-D-erythritol 4-phosphate cytidylyltransferase
MNTALIFAGGTGQRMNSRSKPKQFLELHGKPIIIYTIEAFEYHPEIDNIVIVCLESWIDELKLLLKKNYINKVSYIVGGGNTGHESIYNGLEALKDSAKEDDIILIHDGVRPLVTDQLISENIKKVKEFGTAITVSRQAETVSSIGEDDLIDKVLNRDYIRIAKAPQSFYYKDIWASYQKAKEEHYLTVDSAQLMSYYGYELHTVECSPYNIKITAPADFYVFRALYEVMENQQIFGL